MTIQEGTKALMKELSTIYEEREASAITDWVFEHLTGWKKIKRIVNKQEDLSQFNLEQLEQITAQLLEHRPIHYILREAWFRGMKLYVDENVLIPRPETEELVEWTLTEVDRLRLTVDGRSLRVLDVGTGSGCIPIALKKAMPELEVYACDLSDGALGVARRNAAQQSVEVEFQQLDFLNQQARSALPLFDLIISNPPYISTAEKSTIDRHVIEHEPHLALFVPADDSLIFYRHLAEFGKTNLQAHGCIMMETHYAKAQAVEQLFLQAAYRTSVKSDMHGNDRMVRALRSDQ